MGSKARTVRVVAVLAAIVAAPIAVGGPGAQAAALGVTSFGFTGSEQTYVVPAGVTMVRIEAIGASGAGVGGSDGGSGAVATADLAVTPGHPLYVEVGGSGSTGGFNGGGAPGAGLGGAGGGTGGGATDVRTVSAGVAGTLTSRLVTAAGGGGAGGSAASDTGSDGGDAGQAGSPATVSCGNSDAAPGCGGGAATASAGGLAGLGGHNPGQAGLLALGGGGGLGVDNGGGGGGGGIYGGGGGGAEGGDVPGGGGGGGSSGFAAAATDRSVAIASAQNAAVTITPLFALTVATTGPGSGTVSGSGISCGQDCRQIFAAGTAVTLHADAAAGSAFTGWSGGGCQGTGACVVSITAGVTVRAGFDKRPPNTSITNVTVSAKTVTFRFTSSGATTRFQCAKAKAGAALTFTTCASPKKYDGLAPGRYTVKVRAVGPGGTDPSPAVRHLTIKTKR